MLRHAQVQCLVHRAIRVGQIDVEGVDSRTQRHGHLS
jgi:hypothetical protein